METGRSSERSKKRKTTKDTKEQEISSKAMDCLQKGVRKKCGNVTVIFARNNYSAVVLILPETRRSKLLKKWLQKLYILHAEMRI